MRTTLDLDDGVLAAARAIAEAENRSLGSVISDLARRGLVPQQRSTAMFPTFDVPEDAAPITPDMVQRALDE
ncbi:MAG: antitoxin [Actinophytocola sp.]|nr:antitoxin [Actinophytocola sp.]